MSQIHVTVGLGVSAVAAVLCIVCTATDSWFVVDGGAQGSLNAGLWRACVSDNSGTRVCVDIGEKNLDASVYGSRAFMIIACLMYGGALILGLYTVIMKTMNKAKIVSGCAIALAGIFVVIGTLWYGLESQSEVKGPYFKFGYSIILGWISIPFAIFGGGVIARYGMVEEHDHERLMH
ncbi:claudin-1-like [Glandiceps talaboti]